MPRVMTLLIAVAGLLLALSCWAEPMAPACYAIHTDRSGAQVNWLTGKLEAVGVGYAEGKGELPKRKARMTAIAIMTREAKRAVPGIAVDGKSQIAALPAATGKTAASTLAGAMVVIDEMWNEKTRTYIVVGTAPLFGEVGVTPAVAKALGSIKPVMVKPEEIKLNGPIPMGQTPQLYKDGPYTGIIINADKVPLTPCLFPHILRYDGQELWGPAQVSAARLLLGPVRYAPNVQAALTEKLAGDRPIIAEAIGSAQGAYPAVNLDDVYYLLLEQKKTRLFDLPIVITLGAR